MSSFYDIERDGITQGLLAKFLECRQKARWFLKGYSSRYPKLSITYGNIIHAVLEFAYSDIQKKIIRCSPTDTHVYQYIRFVERAWRAENPGASKEALEYLELSLLIAEATMPLYFDFWHKDFKELAWQGLEQEFKIPYEIEGYGKTFLRGKMDGVFGKKEIWLFETKSKGQINEADMVDTLPMDLQVNFYLFVLKTLKKTLPKGVLYNVVRKIGLEQRQKETMRDFAQRCVEDIKKRPEWYFLRMEVSVSPKEMEAFEAELQGIIFEFVRWWRGEGNHYRSTGACITKYGRCEYLGACNRRMSGLEKRKVVFRELEGEK